MRDIGQPCFSAYADGGEGKALSLCREHNFGCEAARSSINDGFGRPVMCPRSIWEHDILKTGICKRELSLLACDLTGTTPLRDTEPLSAVKAWLATYPRASLLLLCGTKGVGKTLAACWALSKIRRGMPGGKYVLASSVVDPRTDILILAEERLLVVDQLGHEYFGTSPDWAESRFVELLDRRYAEMLPTVLVGNMKRETFEKRYGGVIADRLVGDGLVHSFSSRSLRGAKS